MTAKRSRLALAALGVSVTLAVTAVPLIAEAQPAPPRQFPANPPPSAPPPQADQQYDRNQYDPRGYDRRDSRIDRRLDFLHSALRITVDQERLWDDFAAAMRDRSEGDRGRDRIFVPYRFPPVPPDTRRSAVDQLQRRQQNLMTRMERVDHLLATLKPLYASFNDDQKRIADELLFRADRSLRARLVRNYSDYSFMRPFDPRFGPYNRAY